MGVIRALLAIAVVIGHTGTIFGTMPDGVMAVQSFFIISGFYMSLILNEKYVSPGSYRLFISNRLLRLFPTYIFIALLTLVVVVALHASGTRQELVEQYQSLSLGARTYLGIISATLLGQDTTLFLSVNNAGSLYWSEHFYNSKPVVNSLLLCPQAWSLSIELMFYLVAPLLLRRSLKFILILVAAVFALRAGLALTGHYNDPWQYRFFPIEMLFFLAGNVSYRLYRYLKNRPGVIDGLQPAVFLATVVLLFLFNFLPVFPVVREYIFYIIFTFAVPVVFLYTKNNSLDRFIGELSYPIYLSHWFIIMYCLPFLDNWYHFPQSVHTLLAVTLSVLFSILLIQLLIKPIDRYRERQVQKHNGKDDPLPDPEQPLPVMAIDLANNLPVK